MLALGYYDVIWNWAKQKNQTISSASLNSHRKNEQMSSLPLCRHVRYQQTKSFNSFEFSNIPSPTTLVSEVILFDL